MINAHCHSEWNAAPNLARGDGMMAWLARVLALEGRADFAAGIRRTAEEAGEEGVVFVGDHGRATSAVSEGKVSGVHYRELLRDDAERFPEVLAGAGGLAPHAVHTVFPNTWEKIAGFPGPLSVHVAESPEEMELYRTGGGPMADLLLARDFPRQHPAFLKGRSPIRILDEFRLLGPRTLLVHALYLSDADYDLIAERGARVALCPISNREIGVGFVDAGREDDPGVRALRRMLDRQVGLGIGTDSALSSPTLSLRANAEVLRTAGLGEDVLLRMLTQSGN